MSHPSVSCGRPIRAFTDRPERERQALEVEAGDARSLNCEQVVAGPVRVSCGGGAGTDEVAC